MSDSGKGEERLEYIVPEHRLGGTRTQVLAQLDEVIQGLIGLRQLISSSHDPGPPNPARKRRFHIIRSFFALALALTATMHAGAQSMTSDVPDEHTQKNQEWTFGGFADVAYLYAFNHPANKVFRSRGTAWHVDDLHLNMTGVSVKKKPTEQSRWGAELLVQTGKDDEIFGFSATAPNIRGSEYLRHLGLANVSYLAPVGRGLTLQGGIFSSLIGYDSLYAKDNFNYTRPWGADFTPYLMMGVNASYPFTDKLTGTFYVINGYWHLADANNVPSSGVQFSYKATPHTTVRETVLVGPHQSNTSSKFWRFLSDTIVERRMERVVVAANFHVATEAVDSADRFRAWWVAAQLPIRWNVRGPWSIAVRPEMARDSSGRWTLAEQTVKAFTTTLEYRVPYGWTNTILRLEHRVDNSIGAQGGFFDDFEISPGNVALRPTQHLVVFAAILTFDSTPQR